MYVNCNSGVKVKYVTLFYSVTDTYDTYVV